MNDQAGTAFCPRCKRHDVRITRRNGREEYVLHVDQVGVLTCNNSGRKVQRP